MKPPIFSLPQKPKFISLETNVSFLDLFGVIEQECGNCFLLESLGEESTTARYAVLGFDPEMIVRGRGKKLLLNDIEYEVNNPYMELVRIFPQQVITRDFAGGLVGYTSYDAVNYFEPGLKIKPHPDFDQFCYGVYADGLVQDKMTGQISYFYYAEDRSEKIKEFMKKAKIKKDVKGLHVTNVGHTVSPEEHSKIVEGTKEQILAGNIFQAEVGFKTEYRIKGNALAIYENLRKINPSPHMYFFKFGEKKIIGASPELLLRIRSGEMETFPLAGTIRRGKSEIEDQELAKELLSDPKERAEHTMLVDLHRNDLGRVARFGTVKVRRLLEIKKFSHVQHISSEVVGIIQSDKNMYDAFRSVFPAGTLSGAPKIEAMKIIDENEKDPRGPYGGAVGYFGFNGDCTFAIPIRTLFIAGEYGYAQTSAGIVADSIPEKEYREIEMKLAAMGKALEPFIT